MDKNTSFQCVVSVGIRCFTEIFLKRLDLKRFSMPFDGIYMHSVDDIIYLIQNGIEYNELIYTETETQFEKLNKKHGLRTLHRYLSKDYEDHTTTMDDRYHNATFPHHNLNQNEEREHFNRCYLRINQIQKEKIKTLFCLFLHPMYPHYVHVSQDDVIRLSDFLQSRFNCHLLVIYFQRYNDDDPQQVRILSNNDTYSIYAVNNDAWTFEYIEKELKEIMSTFKIKSDNLITYDYFSFNQNK